MSGLIESFGINLSSLIAQIVNFSILLIVLYLVAYKPLLKMLDERSKRIRESLEHAEYIKQQAAAAERETTRRIDEAIQEGHKIIEQASQTGEGIRQKSIAEARQDAEKLIARTRTAIEQERDLAIGELRRQFADLTILAAEKVIKRSLDKKAHKELIEQVLEESTQEQTQAG
jgi:F-type H+-transporting ATPase subunit b